MHKKVILIIGTVLAGFIAFVLFISARNNLATPPQSLPIPTPFQSKPLNLVIPPDIQKAPTLSPDKGAGLDLQANQIKESENEIQKLSSLPYEKNFVSSTGIDVSLIIPQRNEQSNPWTLTVNFSGIDYQVTSEQKEYKDMKQSFREGASYVFDWIRSNNAEPQKIFMNWGDRAFIQDRAEEWLK